MTAVVSVSTNHTDVIHDSQFDYYGQLLATCSSDRTIKIFSVSRDTEEASPTLEACLLGHDGPVWMVAWAHPRFGQIIASCSYDNRTIIWTNRSPRQQSGVQQHQWRPVHIINAPASVNGISWAPHEFGLTLALANSDGTVTVSSCIDGIWRDSAKVGTGTVAHSMGAMAVSFLPFINGVGQSPFFLASGGCDGCVRLWTSVEGQWVSTGTFQEHSDWVRDVSFAPTITTAGFVLLASCAQDRKVIIRRKKVNDIILGGSGDLSSSWETSTTTLPSGVWRLSWNACGSSLLVTTGDSEAVLLSQGKEFTDSWIVSNIDETTK